MTEAQGRRAHDGFSNGEPLPCLEDRVMVSSFVLGKVQLLFAPRMLNTIDALMLDVVTVLHGQWETTRGLLAGNHSQGSVVGNA